MRFLGMALYAEGPTDDRFLSILLFRLAEDLCLRARENVEINQVLMLAHPRRFNQVDRATRILEAARDAFGAFHILFVHADGASDVRSAFADKVQPAAARIAAEFPAESAHVVAVIPVRESEAWALADGEALRKVFGSTTSDEDFGIPHSPRAVEQIADPKKHLNACYRRVMGPRRRTRDKVPLEAIANRVSLSLLRQVPAFSRLQDEFVVALGKLGIIDSGSP